jgi:hypothetical protein
VPPSDFASDFAGAAAGLSGFADVSAGVALDDFSALSAFFRDSEG